MTRKFMIRMRQLILSLMLASVSAPSFAEESKGINLALLEARQIDMTCRVTLQFKNTLGQNIESLAAEIVLLDSNGLARDFLVLDAGALSPGKRRIRQFDFQEVKCDQLSEILLNDVIRCEGQGLDPRLCAEKLHLSSKSSIKLGL